MIDDFVDQSSGSRRWGWGWGVGEGGGDRSENTWGWFRSAQ